MRKLTKKIKKMRKNYKPSIGLTVKNAYGRGYRTGHMSLNANTYYIEKRKEEYRKWERKVKAEIHQIMRQVMPGLAAVEDALVDRYGFNPYLF